MVYVIVKYGVKDYAKWKPIFDDYGKMRKKAGSTGGKLFHESGKPNDMLILFDWDKKENASKFFASEDTKKTQQSAGVIGKPTIFYLDKIENFSA